MHEYDFIVAGCSVSHRVASGYIVSFIVAHPLKPLRHDFISHLIAIELDPVPGVILEDTRGAIDDIL